MAPIFTDGFDHYIYPADKYELLNGGVSIGMSACRTGLQGLVCSPGGYVGKNVPGASRYVSGVAFRLFGDILGQNLPLPLNLGIPSSNLATGVGLIFASDGVTLTSFTVGVFIDPAGYVTLVDGTGTVLGTSAQLIRHLLYTWHYVELGVDTSTGLVTVAIDGSPVINVSGASLPGLIGQIGYGDWCGNTSVFMDDVYIVDSTGTANWFQGPVPIKTKFVNGAGSYAQWAPFPPGFNNYETVLDFPDDDDISYVETLGSTGQIRDSHTFWPLPNPGATIICADAWAKVKGASLGPVIPAPPGAGSGSGSSGGGSSGSSNCSGTIPSGVVEDLLDYLCMDSRRSTHHLHGSAANSSAANIYYYLDPSTNSVAQIKSSSGWAADIQLYDPQYIYQFITEMDDPGYRFWSNGAYFKKYLLSHGGYPTPHALPMMPRSWTTGQAPVTISVASPVEYQRFTNCGLLDTINRGDVTNITSGPFLMNFDTDGHTVGNLGCVQVILSERFAGRTRERFYFAKGLGFVKWDGGSLSSGSPITGTYTITNWAVHNQLATGGGVTPNFPCGYSAIVGNP